jgi:hypothetical protein
MSAPLSRSIGLAAQELIREAAEADAAKIDVEMTHCAAELGIAAHTLYRWLSGESTLPPERIRELADWFRAGVEMDRIAEWLGLVVGEGWEVLPVGDTTNMCGRYIADEALRAMKESGEAIAEIATALADGKITRAEAGRVQKEVQEAVFACRVLARHLGRVVDGREEG